MSATAPEQPRDSMKSPSPTHDPVCRKLDRVISLSDGVFAFAITLLALSLIVPVISKGAAQTELISDLYEMIPVFISYFVSFLVIASWWKGHNRIFTYISRCNSTLVSLNFYFLLCITIIPFLTSLIMAYGSYPLVTILFASMQVLTGTVLVILWRYASRDHRLIDPHLSNRLVRFNYHREIVVIGIFLVSIPIALLSPTLAQISWIAIAPLAAVLKILSKDIEIFVGEEIEMLEKKE